MVVLAALLVTVGLVWIGLRVSSAIDRLSAEDRQSRSLQVLVAFAPGLEAAERDPRTLLVSEPLAQTARRMLPREFAALDQAWGGTFPFDQQRIQDAHARWTSDWLAWERAHDGEYKLKAAAIEIELAWGSPSLLRARLDAVEREKLDLYQRRYQEYVRVARALQKLAG